MKKFIVKKMVSKNDYFDRELFLQLMKPRHLRKYLLRKIYRNFLNLAKEKKVIFQRKNQLHPMEIISAAMTPISTNIFLKIFK